MNRILIGFIFLIVCSVHAQTLNDKENLKELNKNVISSYQSQKLDEALKLALKSVDLSVKVYGIKGLETAVAYTNLGVIYRDKGKLKESIDNLQKAAEIYGAIPNFNGEQSVAAYEMLAHSQFLSGMKSEAEASYLKAVEIAESKFGKQNKQVYSPTLNLANFYARTGKFEKADNFYLKTYELAIKNFDKEGKEVEQIGDSRSCIFYGRKTDDEKEKAFDTAKDLLFGVDATEKSRTINGKAISLPKPPYPAEAREKRLSSIASVRVKINAEGNVIGVKSICREDILGRAAEYAASRAKFRPALKDGKPVEVIGIIIYNFVP